MIDHFATFASAVRKCFDELSKEPLFEVAADRDGIWEAYLGAFPPGSNPVFRKRTEHDCSCCRSFIRSIGNVVAVQNGAISTVWDLSGLPEPYQTVANAMAAYIRSLPITYPFWTSLTLHGQAITNAMKDEKFEQWSHFSVVVPQKFVSQSCDEVRGRDATTQAVLMRGFKELSPEAVATVADLIESNALYRGLEFKQQVLEFQQLQLRFLSTNGERAQELLAWSLVNSRVARFRNTVIGTLVQDLSEGVDVERAVRSYEVKTAPLNYRRPTALITKGMVDAAMKTIREMGLEPALERRHARMSDVSINSVLFVDNAVRARMKGGVEDLLMQEVRPPRFEPSAAVEIGIEDFLRTILPRTRNLSLYLDNRLAPNFVSMTAPVHSDTASLFRWGNDFAWSYEGNAADSIRDRVKNAGGTVEGVAMRISLAWANTDDLDLHVMAPGGRHIFYADRGSRDMGGYLDVDMNVTSPVRNAVENVRWLHAPRDGVYLVQVHSFTRREAIDVGFTIEVESHRGIETFRFDRALNSHEMRPVIAVHVHKGRIDKIDVMEDIVSGARSSEIWGLKTLDLVRVNALVLSPNYWQEPGVGNKHFMFILEGCSNPLPTRGIYNEFLHPRLSAHSKVFELLGDKTKCPPALEQLSGVGFSSTRKDKVSVIAMGPSLRKPLTIVF